MLNTNDLSTAELQDIAAHSRQAITALEVKGSFRTVKDGEQLKNHRALLRRVRKQLKERIKQLPLF